MDGSSSSTSRHLALTVVGRHPDVAADPTRAESNPARVYLSALAPTGRRTMTACADVIARYLSRGAQGIDDFPWHTVDHSLAASLRGALVAAVSEEEYSPATANKYLCCLRGVLKAAWRLGQMSTDTYHRAIDVPAIRGTRLPAGREVPAEERARILDATRGVRPADVRDQALIALAYLSGARRSELVAISVSDIALHPPVVTIRGKGNKERVVPLPDDAVWWVEPWVDLRGDEAGALFCPINRHGQLQRGRQMTGEAVRWIIQQRARAAGLQSPSPHDFRRTYAGDLLDSGADLSVVSALMGHASVATTVRYDRRAQRAAAKAVQPLRLLPAPAPPAEQATAGRTDEAESVD